MAKRGSKNNKASDDAVAEAEAAEQAEANVSTVASPGETGPIEPLVDIAAEFDREASERVLVAAAGILSSARIVVDEATQAAAPFLSFSQKARIQGMANSFEQQASVAVAPVVQMPSAVRTRVVQDGGGITREEVQTLIDHQVEMAVQRGLGAAGVSPDVPLDKQIERVIEGVVQSLENRLMDYVRKVLTETMEAVEESIDARFEEASEVEVNSDAQVDDRELSDSIAEVRSPQNTVSYDFAGLADIREVRGTTGEVVAVEDNIMVAAGTDDEIAVEMAAEDDEIAVEMDADSAEELSRSSRSPSPALPMRSRPSSSWPLRTTRRSWRSVTTRRPWRPALTTRPQRQRMATTTSWRPVTKTWSSKATTRRSPSKRTTTTRRSRLRWVRGWRSRTWMTTTIPARSRWPTTPLRPASLLSWRSRSPSRWTLAI